MFDFLFFVASSNTTSISECDSCRVDTPKCSPKIFRNVHAVYSIYKSYIRCWAEKHVSIALWFNWSKPCSKKILMTPIDITMLRHIRVNASMSASLCMLHWCLNCRLEKGALFTRLATAWDTSPSSLSFFPFEFRCESRLGSFRHGSKYIALIQYYTNLYQSIDIYSIFWKMEGWTSICQLFWGSLRISQHSITSYVLGDRTVSQVRCHAASLSATCRILQAKTLEQVPYPKLAPMIPTVTLYILFTVLFFSFCDSFRQHSNTAQFFWATLSNWSSKNWWYDFGDRDPPWHTTPINRVPPFLGSKRGLNLPCAAIASVRPQLLWFVARAQMEVCSLHRHE